MSNAALRLPVVDPVAEDVAIVVPRLRPPYPAAIHPDAGAVDRATAAWLRECGVGDTPREAAILAGGRFGELAARAYARATPARLRLVADFITWAFLFDDRCELDRGHDRRAIDALCADVIAACAGRAHADDAPLVRAFADLRRRVGAELGAAAAGFAADLIRFVRAVQAQLDLVGARPSFEAELRTRVRTIGLAPCLHFIDGAADQPRHILAHAARNRLAAEALCWTNDLISLRKELRAGEPHNLVLALAARRGGALQAAVDEAVAHYHRVLDGFAAIDARLRGDTPASIAYSDGLRAWIAALPAWSYASPRYAA